MKTIIAGSRGITDYKLVEAVIAQSGFDITEVVSGGAFGVDGIGEQWAKQRGIPVDKILPDWATHGKAAGPIRNRHMAECSDALIAIWDGVSRGTHNMIQEAKKLGLQVYAYHVPSKTSMRFFRTKSHGNPH